ncbi:carbohydrate porin [Aliiruegeria sabulilitoris]|uniref:carbohydrate porin n=1 Tax=Aliiruegeria sabulilitoris TaxID=1510458 RepID=UPI0009EBD486|nr:carbohydrate porin [Aliiruegeria sabulilitoris]NDR55861.1 carbohydrate porin [Pseudoruegeria sp. M32A2M]
MSRSRHVAAALLTLSLLPNATLAQQGLSGPSSVEADLTPGDGLTDPQPRTGFPRNVLPGYFGWKDGLAENGFRFNLDYFALGQWSDSDLGEGEAGGGVLRFYGSWQATENGSLTFKIEDRQAYGAVAPQFFGFDSGALSITGTAFNDNGTMLTNLFWTQRDPEGRWTVQIGQLDLTDFVDVYGLVSPWTSFQNLAFNTNPTINAPNPGLGIAGAVKLGENIYVVGAVADANGDPTEPSFDVFETGETFKSIEIGYTSGSDRIYFDNIHLTVWQSDAAEDGSRAEDKGAAFSAAWLIDNTWMPFLRAGVAEGTAALYERSLSTGLGWYRRNTDLAGIGLNWAEAKDIDETQFTTEAFYRFNISPDFQITPSIQYIRDPLLNPGQDDLTILGLRARIVF